MNQHVWKWFVLGIMVVTTGCKKASTRCSTSECSTLAPFEITGWYIAREYGTLGLGRLAISPDGSFVDPRVLDFVNVPNPPALEVHVVFSSPVDRGQLPETLIQFVGFTREYAVPNLLIDFESEYIPELSWIEGDTVLVARFSTLPNRSRIRAGLSQHIIDKLGRPLEEGGVYESREVVFGLLQGDVNGDGEVQASNVGDYRSRPDLFDNAYLELVWETLIGELAIPFSIGNQSHLRSDLNFTASVNSQDRQVVISLADLSGVVGDRTLEDVLTPPEFPSDF